MLLKAKLFRKIHSSRAPYLKKKKKSLYLLFSQYKKAHWLSSPNVWTLSKSPLKRRTTEENARRGQCRLPLPSGGEITCNPEKLREAGHGRTSSVHLFLYTVLLTFILFFFVLFIYFLFECFSHFGPMGNNYGENHGSDQRTKLSYYNGGHIFFFRSSLINKYIGIMVFFSCKNMIST